MTRRFPSRPRVKPRLEKDEQLAIRKLMLQLGAKEYVLGTKRKRNDAHHGTMQTPGIPDLQFFLPAPKDKVSSFCMGENTRRLVIVEVKRERVGRFTSEQIEYRGLCAAAGIDYIGGSLDDVIVWLVREGYVKAENFSHERQAAIAEKVS